MYSFNVQLALFFQVFYYFYSAYQILHNHPMFLFCYTGACLHSCTRIYFAGIFLRAKGQLAVYRHTRRTLYTKLIGGIAKYSTQNSIFKILAIYVINVRYEEKESLNCFTSIPFIAVSCIRSKLCSLFPRLMQHEKMEFTYP